MKRLLLFLPALFILGGANSLYSGALVDTITKATKHFAAPTQDLAIGIVAEKQKQRDDLLKEREFMAKARDDFDAQAKTALVENQNEIDQAEAAIKITLEDEFLKQKSIVLGETLQIIKDTKREYDQYISLIDRFLKFLNEYLQNPDFKEYRLQHASFERPYHAFEEILKLHDQIIDQENRSSMLSDQEKSSLVELESRRQGATANVQAYKKKRADLSSAISGSTRDTMYEGFESDQLNELLALEKKLSDYRKVLDELTIKKVKTKAVFTSMQLFVEKSHLSILKEYLRKAKPGVRVSELDIAEEKEQLATDKKQYYAQKESYRQQIDEYANRMTVVEEELNMLAEQLKVPLGRDLDEWNRTLSQAAQAYLSFCRVATLNTMYRSLDTRRELLQAQEAHVDEKFQQKEIKVRVKESYYRVVARPSVPEEHVERELKRYDAPRAKSKANLSRYEDRGRRAADALGESKRLIEQLGTLKKEIQQKRSTVFKSSGRSYNECLLLINQAETRVRENIDILSRLTGAYSSITGTINDTMRLIDFISGELSALIGVLSRSEYAVTWQGFRNILSDVGTFFNDIKSYVLRFKLSAFMEGIQDSFKQPLSLLLFIIKLALLLSILILVLFGINYLLPAFNTLIASQAGYIRPFGFLLMMLAHFIRVHFVSLAIWVIAFAAVHMLTVHDPYLYIFFYLVSIPYLLYMARALMRYFVQFNREHEHVFVSDEFEWRLVSVVSGLLYVTVFFTLFREAFKLANYYKSELPTILLAANFIVFQTALMLLLTKDLILNLIPVGATPFWRDFFKLVRAYIDRYFMLIQLAVFAVIVMSNPYVGFGKLVLYVFRSVTLTGLLVALFYWLYEKFKSGVSRAFFIPADDVVHERFANAKTWFGIVIIGSFALFALIGGLMAARVWGWVITFQDAFDVIREPLMFKGTPDPITLLSIAKIMLFVMGGFALSYILNRFVLDRIFDLFLVDAGVQHTVTSITRYVVLATATMFGFTYVGLGQHIGVLLAALVFSIGWVLKDPIADFAAYFIILVQRPLKIGDYIKVDETTAGVVRRITPRAVVLRKKNSTTLIVPNASMMNRTIENWNYTRNFVAVNDLELTIEYSADPVKVKELLHEVVQAHPNILRNPKPIVRLNDFETFGFRFMVRGYISPVYVLEMWDIASDLRLAMVKKLMEHNIRIAVPTWKPFDGKTDIGIEMQEEKKESNE